MRVGVVALAIGFVLAACGGGDDSASSEPSPCPTPPEVTGLGRLPEDLRLDEFGQVHKLNITRGFLGAEATSKMSIVEAFPPIYRKILDGGYQVLSAENEGFEAEIFFAKGARVTGTLLLREGPCRGEITIRLIYGDRRLR